MNESSEWRQGHANSGAIQAGGNLQMPETERQHPALKCTDRTATRDLATTTGSILLPVARCPLPVVDVVVDVDVDVDGDGDGEQTTLE